MLQMRKLSLNEETWLAQDHVAVSRRLGHITMTAEPCGSPQSPSPEKELGWQQNDI